MASTPAQMIEQLTRNASSPACRISARRHEYLTGLLDASYRAGEVTTDEYGRLCNRLASIVTRQDPIFWAHEEGRLF